MVEPSQVEHRIESKLITVILDKDGSAMALASKLKDKKGLLTGNIQNARGSGAPSSANALKHQVEKELLTVVVPENRADEIFEFIYHECAIGDSYGGFMFQAGLGKSSEYTLPVLPE